ncbi:MAG: A/G-specific adenine glycosylase [Pseudohongiellaceae bacterium]|nr:A/G-specific adenine glycosylase [Pseudohongiellaceae bacterium]
MGSKSFSQRVLDWHAHSGRHDLPWQQDPNPYRVWVSEIMLQQTQVATVIPYFQRCMALYPDVQSLGAAPIDEVLHLWTGLGYYARARNMHKAAGIVSKSLDGKFPKTVEGLCELPGIGRSTAGAILSLGSKVRAAILDGNVKRVLCRYHTIEGWPDKPSVQKILWPIAEEATPKRHFRHYTQAMMDLGATVCTRSKPNCTQCPLSTDCKAFQQGLTAEFPHRKPKTKIPTKHTHMLICQDNEKRVLLEKRPDSGIWGGLWSLPEFGDSQASEQFLNTIGNTNDGLKAWPTIRHTFSHYHLQIQPLQAQLYKPAAKLMEPNRWLWYSLTDSSAVGLAAPIKAILDKLRLEL